jgi:hypothetical protein
MDFPLSNTAYGEDLIVPVKSHGVEFRQMTNTVMLGVGPPASALLRPQCDSPCRALVVKDEDDICCFRKAIPIHINLGAVTRNAVRERACGLAVVKNHFRESAGLFLNCAVVADHGSDDIDPYGGLDLYCRLFSI